MAVSFAVQKIEVPVPGPTRQLVSTGLGEEIFVYTGQTIWPSQWFVAFELQNLTVHFILYGTCSFSEAWRAPNSKYVVEGELGSVRIRSKPMNVPSDSDDSVIAQNFTFVGGTVPTLAAPFKCHGHWRWLIKHIPFHGQWASYQIAKRNPILTTIS